MSSSIPEPAPDEIVFDLSEEAITDPYELDPDCDLQQKSNVHEVSTYNNPNAGIANDTLVEHCGGDRESKENIDLELERIRGLAQQAAIPKFGPPLDDNHYEGIEHVFDDETSVDVVVQGGSESKKNK